MTKEITKAFILQEIQDKFQLRELAPEVFGFSEMVVPTYDIEQHLKRWELIEKIMSITSATAFHFFTVPPTERWTLRAYQLVFYNEGAYKVSGVYFLHGTLFHYLDLEKGQTTSYLINLPAVTVLEPNTEIRALIDTYVSTANLKLVMHVQKETIR